MQNGPADGERKKTKNPTTKKNPQNTMAESLCRKLRFHLIGEVQLGFLQSLYPKTQAVVICLQSALALMPLSYCSHSFYFL